MTERSTCWSLTEQVATREDAEVFMNQPVPPGWKLRGQLEKAPTTGQLHLQLMLETPRIRFGTVKKQFPKAHIEVARDKLALSTYVGKHESRVAAVAQPLTPTIWEFNKMVADSINTNELSLWILTMRDIRIDKHPDTVYADGEWLVCTDNIWKSIRPNEMLTYIDKVISQFIADGVRGAEYMGVNPMFRSAWKTYGRALLERASREKGATIKSEDNIYNDGEALHIQIQGEGDSQGEDASEA